MIEDLLAQRVPSAYLLILRLPGIFGLSFNSHGMFDYFCRAIMKSTPIRLHSPEVLQCQRDWVYAEDLLNFVEFAMRTKLSGTFNLVSGDSLSIKNWIEKAEECVGIESTLEFENIKKRNGFYDLIFDNAYLRTILPPIFKFRKCDFKIFY